MRVSLHPLGYLILESSKHISDSVEAASYKPITRLGFKPG